ncbi:pyridoxal phosphate-dependent aminotransferase [Clostridiaceae bacterium UIB06]|nr:pyridoxal phosphate-dependent aminotransferase [Clostridiaceae bacterium UIB06]
MKYDFDKVFDKENTDSVKWNFAEKVLGDKDVIPMWIADMDFQTVPEVKEAIIKRASQGVYGYSETLNGYYDSITNWIEKRHQWKIEREWLCISPGVVTALSLVVKALTHPGDKVVIQSPVYYPFFNSILRNGCEIVNNPLKAVEGRYHVDYEDLEEKVKDERVKLMIICNPHNPVGRVWTKEELQRIGEICLKNDVLVVADEIHSDLIYKGHKYTPFASISKEFEQNSITCTAPSKTFNLAGLQTSNIIIPNEKLRREYNIALENIGISRLNLFGVIGCEAAYKYGEEWLDELLDYLEENKRYTEKYISEKIPKLKVVKAEGTYLLWINFRELGMNSKELKKFMLTKAKVAFNEGFIFGEGGEGFERMNIACPRSILQEALRRIEEAVNNI